MVRRGSFIVKDARRFKNTPDTSKRQNFISTVSESHKFYWFIKAKGCSNVLSKELPFLHMSHVNSVLGNVQFYWESPLKRESQQTATADKLGKRSYADFVCIVRK